MLCGHFTRRPCLFLCDWDHKKVQLFSLLRENIDFGVFLGPFLCFWTHRLDQRRPV